MPLIAQPEHEHEHAHDCPLFFAFRMLLIISAITSTSRAAIMIDEMYCISYLPFCFKILRHGAKYHVQQSTKHK